MLHTIHTHPLHPHHTHSRALCLGASLWSWLTQPISLLQWLRESINTHMDTVHWVQWAHVYIHVLATTLIRVHVGLKKCHCSIQNRLYMYVLTHTPWFNTCTVQLAITYQTVSLLCIATSSLTLLDLNCLQRVLTYGSSSKYKSWVYSKS